MRLNLILQMLLCVAAVCGRGLFAHAADKPELAAMRGRAVEFLKLTQAADGSWTSPNIPGITALVTTALLNSGASVDDPAVAGGLKFLLSLKQEDGGIYRPQSSHRNYETSITMLALVAANADGRYTQGIRGAEKFLRGLQWDETEGLKPEDPGFGGAGYGSHQRPDLSNTTFLLEALKAAGVKEDDPAMKNALVFVSRCQNLETEHNNTEFAAKVGDGGFYYTPAAGGNSQAGLTPEGGLRSYASMTYAGLKSMLYAGVKKDDPRVTAALAWIRKFYSLEENPGLGQQGLYYYYHTFAKTLSVYELDTITDADGNEHNWRAELVEQLAGRQKENGSWVNAADRWYEGDPHLVTAYALMALSYVDVPRETVSVPVDKSKRQVEQIRIERISDVEVVHHIQSPWQRGTTAVRVLLPEVAVVPQAASFDVLYVLPVEAGTESRWGDGLNEIRRHDLHNELRLICVAPTFADLPWYADNPENSEVQQERYLVEGVVPYVEQHFPVNHIAAARLLVGFSKSGWGAFSLLLRHPEVFGKAAAWDAPLMMATPGQYGSGPIFGSGDNFEKYQLTKLIGSADALKGAPQPRLIHLGHGNFREHHEQFEELLARSGIPHVYVDGPVRRHHWETGWLPEAVRLLHNTSSHNQ